MLRDTVEAPADTPSSLEENDFGDEAEPASTELQPGDDTLPQAHEPVDNSETKEETASESIFLPIYRQPLTTSPWMD